MGKCKCEHWQSCPECTSALRLAQIEIERLTQRNDELRTANGFADLEADIEWLRTETKALREVIISAAHTLEQARVWDGMKWHWNINANATRRVWEAKQRIEEIENGHTSTYC